MLKPLKNRFHSLVWWAFVAWCLQGAAVLGSTGVTTIVDGYSLRSWQVEDGLPQNLVTSCVQTKDGHVWFGTYGGLARFDGVRFQNFDSVSVPALQDRRITSLFEDSKGVLWIGHESGLVSKYEKGAFDQVLGIADSPGGKVRGVGEDGARRIWVLKESGAIVDARGHEVIPSLIEGIPQSVMGWSCSPAGEIWVLENGQSAGLKGNRLEPLSLEIPLGHNFVLALTASSDGGVWLLCDDRIRKWKNGQWIEDRGGFRWPAGPLSCAKELADGTLAVGTIYSGLYLVPADDRPVAHFDAANGLTQNWIRFIGEDRESGIWLGTGTSGVVRIQATPFTTLEPPDKWKGCSVLAVASDAQGALWVGTDGAGLYRYKAGAWDFFGSQAGLSNGYMPAIAVTPKNEVYASHFWWGSPFHLQGDLFVRAEGVSENSSPVFAMLPSLDGSAVLIGSREGLARLEGGKMVDLFKSENHEAGGVCAIAEGADGAIWAGLEEGGLVRLHAGKKEMFGRAQGLPSTSVRCLRFDGEGALWIGTGDGGLSRFRDGVFSNIGVEQGLVDQYVGNITDDGLGHFWFSTHHGLQRVALRDLNRCADRRAERFESQIYDNHDGLPTVEFTGGLQSSACLARDGKLWFASNRGLLSADPGRIRRNLIEPPVVLSSMLVDGKTEMPLTSGLERRLAANHERIEFRFSGLSFAAPDKVRFKYRLEGIDGEWIDSGTRRTAYYSRLPAGDYEFRVIGCNNDNVWNVKGASVSFSVAPFFWATWWFVAISLGAVAATTAFFVRIATKRRAERKMAELKRLHAVEEERSRIARDIHDDVGAILSQISMFSQPTPRELASPERSAATLARIYTVARELTRSFDEIVWAVDPRHDSLEGLLGYMGRYAQGFLAGANISCRLNLPVDVPAWPTSAETRHSLFLAFKEALNNVVKHSNASEVRISLHLGKRSFVLEIRDDGRGLPVASQPGDSDRAASGNGLQNMKDRLAKLRGRCDVANHPDGGTIVTFEIWIHSADTSTQ